ncbi:MAG TPA: 6-phospho-beta-glucosidase [Verrucomicrobiae bacterium]|nr:6-phospho-beta-glucosidase [Verrucomicrobiae bacterium]
MRDIKLCVVGAGGSYTPELVAGILERAHADLPVVELSLTDTDSERLDIMAGLARRMIEHRQRRIAVTTSPEVAEAARNADFVVTQIRVGGMRARHIDETIPLKYGIIGQETTGPGGMFKALRTIPVMIDIAETVSRVAPNAFILNYTNPSGIVTEAVLTQTSARLLGLCSSIPQMQVMIAGKLKPEFGDVRVQSVGLNHLGFVHRILAGGEDVTQAGLNWLAAHDDKTCAMTTSALKSAQVLGAMPVLKYGDLYFHRTAEVQALRKAVHTRAETVTVIEAEVLAQAADPETLDRPTALIRRGGDGYSAVTFDTLNAILNNSGDEIVMSTLNRGAVAGLPDDVAVETVCRVDASGARALPMGEMPVAFRGLVQAVKTHETLTVKAAMTRSRALALQALLAHPLVGDIDVAAPMLDEMLAAHGLDFQ